MIRRSMDAQPLTIQTNRLTLRPLQPKDAYPLHRIYQSEGVLRYFPNQVPPALERVERFVINQLTHWEQHGYGNWGVQLDDQGDIIGWVGLQFVPELIQTEVGFLLDRPYWGKGYATEAALASLRFGFESVGLKQVIALVHPENVASIHVIEKCGMDYMDTIQLWGIELRRYHLVRIGS